MPYTSSDTPVCVLAGEQALANAISLARYQWPALFNYASQAFFQSEWFLKSIDGKPACARLVLPIRAAPTVLESAVAEPRYLAYPIKDLPLPGAEEDAPGVPICAQVEELVIKLPPQLPADLGSDWQVVAGQIYVQARLWVGMLAASPGLPAVQEQPVLMLKFPVQLTVILEGGLIKNDSGATSLSLKVDNTDLTGLQPDALTSILNILASLAEDHLLPGFLAKVNCPFQLADQDLPNIQQGSLQVSFPAPIHIKAAIDARSANAPNPESMDGRLGIYAELEAAREVHP